jgi:hypothetical protein
MNMNYWYRIREYVNIEKICVNLWAGTFQMINTWCYKVKNE